MGGIGLQLFILGFIGLVVCFHAKILAVGGSKVWKHPLFAIYVSLLLIIFRIIYRLIKFSGGVYLSLPMHGVPFHCLKAAYV
ncbi:hypothetical protein DFH08DRAFT_961901 [Mycena albidolilacea]|uniref:Uncharacterized protein n=1 Tax=Mycena albidolilacea TaxID=1033008 RepID=A0AAD6ZXU2_9AGAR|nr:hypothetical protein DFH08DRAFT_961901 [Mycena albidolilacea]